MHKTSTLSIQACHYTVVGIY